ncbi:WYL domain-containing protein [Desulfovibrio desulfuricans]|uniref:WYL domain-containing protein n=1 Tax=Desulfovibrio desulfuricans TaxID=876 RepID=UPI00177DE82D|nr:WYL domain-containing protein [Desulfovibrio desulfuricans]MBD8896220.1 WYL domain-containing protein [Desulfovibrio desulfuricans]
MWYGFAAFVVLLLFLRLVFSGQESSKREQRHSEDGDTWDRDDWVNSLVCLWKGCVYVKFTYKDFWNGNEYNERAVRLEKVLLSKDKRLYLYGYCYLRNEYRTFKLPRISSAIKELNSGMYFSHYEFMLFNDVYLPDYLNRKYIRGFSRHIDKEEMIAEYDYRLNKKLSTERRKLLKVLRKYRTGLKKANSTP